MSLYQRMKARGIDMRWYEKQGAHKHTEAIPLTDDHCGRLSIYMLKRDGSLWTVSSKGKPHKQVRPGKKKRDDDVFVCLHCRQHWKTYELDGKHGG